MGGRGKNVAVPESTPHIMPMLEKNVKETPIWIKFMQGMAMATGLPRLSQG